MFDHPDDDRPVAPEFGAALRALNRTIEAKRQRLPDDVRATLPPFPPFAEVEQGLLQSIRTPGATDGLSWLFAARDLYILDRKHAVPCDDLLAWLRWFDENASSCLVAATDAGSARVRTQFLGTYDERDGAPLLFETTVVGGKLDGLVRRYATWGQAEAGHRWTVGAGA